MKVKNGPTWARVKIRELLKEGIYHQDKMFLLLYPHFDGHYSTLRHIINEEKNNA